MSLNYRIRLFHSFTEMSPPFQALLAERSGSEGIFLDPEWFEHLMQHFFDEGDELRIYGVEAPDDGKPMLVAPLRFTATDYAVRKGRVIASISHPENYTTAALVFNPVVEDRRGVLEALFRHLGQPDPEEGGPRLDAIRIWPFELDSAFGDDIRAALLRSGYIVQTYTNSFNRYEDTTGLAYDAYFALRSANMRYNVRRRQRALERRGGLEMKLITREEDIEPILPEYLAVSRASWKTPATMYSLETIRMMHLCAARGCLRLGILRLDGVAVAVQFWIVTSGTAHCARLAYDETYRKLAVGVVLTNFMVAHVLDQDHVDKLDYGYGKDEYKRGWMKSARDYYGIIAFNPSTARGRFYAVWNIQGRRMKNSIRWVLGRVGWKRFRKPTPDHDESEPPA